jgi:Holliday junction resolvase-like predicted endonuclease
MNAFEELIASLLEREGWWVRAGYKVSLTKELKVLAGRPSMPRPEIDLLAYKAAQNELWVVECKSYLDSYGVHFSALVQPDKANRFKLFTDPVLRDIVVDQLVSELTQEQMCLPNPTVRLCLAAGKVKTEEDRHKIRDYFTSREWLFLDDRWIRAALHSTAKGGYEDSIAPLVAKLLLRASK